MDNRITIYSSLFLILVILFLLVRNKKLKKEAVEAKELADEEILNVRRECDEEKKQQLIEHNLEIQTIREECKQSIKYAKEHIENRKSYLLQMSEKDLLTNIMLALDGYSDRFQRVETILENNQMVERNNNHEESEHQINLAVPEVFTYCNLICIIHKTNERIVAD